MSLLTISLGGKLTLAESMGQGEVGELGFSLAIESKAHYEHVQHFVSLYSAN